MITIIVAFDENRLIGNGNKLPWHIAEEFKHFKETTMGGVVILGRKTWDSLPTKPLPGRVNIVISRNQTSLVLSPTQASKKLDWLTRSLEEALELAKKWETEIFILGGLQVYQAALPLADRILASKIKGKYEGDVFFPELTGWDETLVSSYDQFDVFEYRRANESAPKPA